MARTGLLRLIDALLGPDQTRERRRFCQAFESTVRDRYHLDAEEEAAVRSMRLDRVGALLEAEVTATLDALWEFPRSRPDHQGVTAWAELERVERERPRPWLSLISDLTDPIHGTAVARAFHEDRARLMAVRYAFDIEARARVHAMSPLTIASDAAAAVDNLRFGFSIVEMQYGNDREALRGPWIEFFEPELAVAGDCVALHIEGTGFIVARPFLVGLVQRRLDPATAVAVPCVEARVHQTVPQARVEGAAPTPIPQRTPSDPCLPGACNELEYKDEQGRFLAVNFGEKFPTLTSLALAEKRHDTPSAARFVVEVRFDLTNADPGEYDVVLVQLISDHAPYRVISAPGPTSFHITKGR